MANPEVENYVVPAPTFEQRIRAMNTQYRLPVERIPVCKGNVSERLWKFKQILLKEVDELDAIIVDAGNGSQSVSTGDEIGLLVPIADLLADVVVYCRSEAMKFGIPLERVLDVVMDSNESKLGADGQPIYDENGKFLKGPNYEPPEQKIKALLMLFREIA